MLSLDDYMLITTDQGVGILTYDQDDYEHGKWNIDTYSEFKSGSAILSGVCS